jgi:hypothetical protein
MVLDQGLNDCRVCQGGGVTDVVNLSCCNPLEDSAHDLAGTGLWQCISELDFLKKRLLTNEGQVTDGKAEEGNMMTSRSDQHLAVLFLILGIVISYIGWALFEDYITAEIVVYVFVCSMMILLFVTWALRGRPPWPYIP